MNPLTQSKKTTILPALVAVTLTCFALSPQARAACLDGCNNSLFNVFQGNDALINNTTGAGNTALGFRSLFANTDGSFSTGVGAGALVLNNGSSNTAVGTVALLLNTSGTWNTAAGTDAMVLNDTGSYNVAFGGYALASNVDGAFNSAFGESALSQNVSGINNTAVGHGALENNDFNGGGAGMANFNTAVGAQALGSNIDGAANTAIGDSAFADNSSGSDNTVVGWQAGAGVEGNENIYIGATCGLPGGGSEDGTIRIGDPVHVSACFIAGITGAPAPGGNAVFVDANGKLGTAPTGSPLTMTELLKEHQTVQQLKVTTEKQAARIALQESQIQTLTTALKQQAELESTVAHQQKQIEALTAGLQKVSAQVEASKPAPQVVNNP